MLYGLLLKSSMEIFLIMPTAAILFTSRQKLMLRFHRRSWTGDLKDATPKFFLRDENTWKLTGRWPMSLMEVDSVRWYLLRLIKTARSGYCLYPELHRRSIWQATQTPMEVLLKIRATILLDIRRYWQWHKYAMWNAIIKMYLIIEIDATMKSCCAGSWQLAAMPSAGT